MQFDPHHLAALSGVLRHGSFDAAANALHVTPSAISQRIKALEERVGSTLINRGTPCTGTPHGLRIAKHAEDIGLLENALTRDLQLEASDAQRHLRIAINADSLATWFVQTMVQLPDILFDLELDDQDHSADWLKRGAVSAAITSTPSIPGCDAYPLGAIRYVATTSPEFHNRWFPEGITQGSLNLAPCLVFDTKDGLQRDWMAAQGAPRATPPSHYLPSTHAFVDAAVAGLGWGMNPEPLVRRALRRGRLVPLNDQATWDVPLVWQVSRVLAPALKPVTDAVVQSARAALVQP
ncbi:LysR family transcriptional regulator ArgP [uncultured Pelagimonas sp.]|uniref:LysR family transcriptional regulator ArgP n=1 Tax=uncultured Pelagimonas sp. TaxID=1618102 RepID=UPI0026350645|nr:LysR family transcriptional regulator ArgP [uncultured Pelagimonas sp.]